MGVRILDGLADGSRRAAAMYDSVTGTMLGPIWEAEDASEQIEAFQSWLAGLPFASPGVAEMIGLGGDDMPRFGADGNDVRHWGDGALEKLVAYWRRDHVEDGLLKLCTSDDPENHQGDTCPVHERVG